HFVSRHLFLRAQARFGNVPGYYQSSRVAGLRLEIAQRLGLLQTLVNEFSSIADFSEIVTAG
ncbi:MAG TPA: hypothetical protein VJW20_09015, partial [Candidatus Angelobacter sp.]|nr:hypothetical protein [Candidatus Angelobacter sp.]